MLHRPQIAERLRNFVCMAPSTVRKASLSRAVGIAFGLGTQVFFAVTVCYLFLFLRDGSTNYAGNWLAIDCLLALQFAIPHSLLLLPVSRTAIARIIPSELFGTLFSAVTCSSLWLIFSFWRCAPSVVWDLNGLARAAVLFGFYG